MPVGGFLFACFIGFFLFVGFLVFFLGLLAQIAVSRECIFPGCAKVEIVCLGIQFIGRGEFRRNGSEHWKQKEVTS